MSDPHDQTVATSSDPLVAGARDARERSIAPARGGIQISADSIQLTARRIDFGGTLQIEELRLSGTDATASTDTGGALRIAQLDGTLTLTEVSLNRFLAGRSEDMLRGLQVAMLTGKVRISGRYGVVPFTFSAVPEVEGGARIRLDPRQISVVGVPLPGFGAQVIGERINARFADAFDITRLPLAIRLTGLSVEPGRFVLMATAEVDLRHRPA